MGKRERESRKNKQPGLVATTPADIAILDRYVAELGISIDPEEQNLWRNHEFRPINLARTSAPALSLEASSRLTTVINIMAASKNPHYRSSAAYLLGRMGSGDLVFAIHQSTLTDGRHQVMTVYPDAENDRLRWVLSVNQRSVFGRFTMAEVGLVHEGFHLASMTDYQKSLPQFMTAEEQAEDIVWKFNKPEALVAEESQAHLGSCRAYIHEYGLGVRLRAFDGDAVEYARNRGIATPTWMEYIRSMYSLLLATRRRY